MIPVRPFRVWRSASGWVLLNRATGRSYWGFTSPAEAADYAGRTWPWWP